MKADPIKEAFANPIKVDIGPDAPADHQPPPDGPPDGEGPPPRAMDAADTPEARAAAFPLNDYGNGLRLVEYFGENICYVPRLGWYRWGGERWRADEDAILVRGDAQQIAARIENEITCIALEEWETDALDRWLASKDQHKELAAIAVKDRDAGQRELWAELEAIRIPADAIKTRLKSAKDAHRKHARASGNTSKISNMLAEAITHAKIDVAELNADKMMVNCESGVLVFSQVSDDHGAAWGASATRWQVDLLPHERAQMITKMARAPYDPHGENDLAQMCPNFLKFLDRVQPDLDMQAFLRRWFGYCLLGVTDEQKLAYFHGAGRNGKSTLVDTLARIVDDYAATLNIETLTGNDQGRADAATPDLLALQGARFVRASEPEQGTQLKESKIKQVTGGEPIKIRRMHSEFLEIMPECKITIQGNSLPQVRGADDGIWRRIMLVPWDEQIANDEVDRHLPEKLWAERPGIFAWMVAGCLEWLADGLQEPQAIKDATAGYRSESDPIRQFILEECTITSSDGNFSAAASLRDAFNAWRLSNANPAWGSRTFAVEFKRRMGVVKNAAGTSFKDVKRGGTTGYMRLVINQEALERIEGCRDQLDAAARSKG